MAVDRARLSSLATHLEELSARVTEAADDLSGGPDDDVSATLYEVERSLRSATRRLSAVVRGLNP